MTSFVNKPKKGDYEYSAELNGQIIHFYAASIGAAEAYAQKYFKPSMKNRPNLKVWKFMPSVPVQA